MLHGSTAITHGSTVEADVCIVGAGPAGISLALRLIGSGLDVVLLESGEVEESPAAQELNEGDVVGLPYFPLDETRFRSLGGSSGRWAGWCRPLDALDMEDRPWVPMTGWPIGRAGLDRYYDEAAGLCELESTDFQGVDTSRVPPLYRAPFIGGDVALVVWQGSPPTKFGRRYRDRLATSRVRVITDATATSVTRDAKAGRATGVEVRARSGTAFRVVSGAVVLCAGAIETARLLLVSGGGPGLGNENDLVGRHFMEHPHVVTGRLLLAARGDRAVPIPAIDRGWGGMAGRIALHRPLDSVKLAYTVSDGRKRNEGLLNAALHLRTVSPTITGDNEAYAALKLVLGNIRSPRRFVRQVSHDSLPAGVGTLMRHIVTGLPELTRALYDEGMKRPSQLALYTQAEQSPNPQSRVTVDRASRDPFGVPKVRLDWRLSSLDKESVIRTQEIVAAHVQGQGLGDLIPEPAFRTDDPDWGPGLTGGHHHMGTARMADDARSGVVDRHGEVHTVRDLFIGDASVFPNGGFANPMLTSVAMALRLGDHIAARYRPATHGSEKAESSQPMHGHVPALSVVVPVYNGARYLREAIDSVLAQTFRDFEVVVVDDGSTDESWAIIEGYAAVDARVRPQRNERNLGVVGALNRGVTEARAQLIARMDADDICLPERFERQLRYLENNPDVAVVGSFYRHMSRDGAVLGLSETGPVSREDFRHRRGSGEPTTVCHPTAMFWRRLFDSVGGYDPAMFGAEDLDLFDRMADHGPVIALTEPLLLYRIHSTSQVMTTFFEARIVHRLVRARGRARSRGERPPTLEEYLAAERALPWWRRLGIRLEDASNYRYRAAGVAWSVGERRRAWRSLALSIVIRPDYALPRIWSQRLSPRARRALRMDGARDPM